MNEAKKLARISDSNPASVLSRISAAQGVAVENLVKRETTFVDATLSQLPITSTEQTDSPCSNSVVETLHTTMDDLDSAACQELVNQEFASIDQPTTIKLRISPETHPDFDDPNSVEGFLDSCIESAEQVQQLAQRLGKNEDELKAREATLEKRIETWNERVQSMESEFELRLSQLQQQASNVRCQQINLMQLQSDIIKSHEATKEAIESLVVEPGDDAQTVATLKALKYQLSGRFDYIARRWEHLAGLLQSQRDAEVAQHSIDDSVDWTGELS